MNLKTQLKKNSGPLNDMLDFIPLHLTFQGDVVWPDASWTTPGIAGTFHF